MITEELYDNEKEVSRVISLFCSNQIQATLSDQGVEFSVRLKDIRNGEIQISQVTTDTPGADFNDYIMRPLSGEVALGTSIYLFDTIPVSKTALGLPDVIRAHPKRKHARIKVRNNQFVSNMYSVISMKVVDFTIQDEELAKKIHLIISTIESHLTRSENFDMAKVTLFDGTEKNIITRLIKKMKKPFIVFDSKDFKIKDDLFLSYTDYIKYLSEEGYDIKNIMGQLDKVKEFYLANNIKSEAIVPLVFEDEAIGQIRVVSMKEKIGSPQARRLVTLSQNAVENLFDKCSFEIVSKQPQEIIDLSVGGGKFLLTANDMFKYVRQMKRLYLQIHFPDESVIKTMATIVNTYDHESTADTRTIGIKFSANIDWRDKNKLNEFISSVMRLEKQS